MVIFKKIWQGWLKFAFIFGNIITAIIMTVFYFTIFAIFAIPFKIFSKPLAEKSSVSNWILKDKTINSLKDFQYE